MTNKIIKCKHCGSINFSKQGYRRTDNRGKIQKYYCNDCKRYFTFDDGFYRMRTDNRTIAMSIDMYLSNLSSRKMRNQLKRVTIKPENGFIVTSEIGLADTYYERVKDLSRDRLERLYRMNNVRYHCMRRTRNAGILRALRERNSQVQN